MLALLLVTQAGASEVSTPLGTFPINLVRSACESPNVMVGRVVATQTFWHPITSGGEWLYDKPHTRITLKTLRHVKGENVSSVKVIVRGMVDYESGTSTITPSSVQPTKGSVYAVAYARLQEDYYTWKAGTVFTTASLYVHPGSKIPSGSVLNQQLQVVCSDL